MPKIRYYMLPERFVTIPYQIVLFIISFGWILFFSIDTLFKFNPVEKSPVLQMVTPDVIAQWHKDPVYINTGLNISSFVIFDIIKNDFKLNVQLWFEFDPQKTPFELVDQFIFVGATKTLRSPPIIEDLPNGMKRATYHIWLEFSSELLYRRFPLDDHILYLTLTSDAVKASDLIYQVQPSNFRINEKIQMGGWRIVEHNVKTGYLSGQISKTLSLEAPRVVFSVGISKEDIRQTLLILLPLLFLFYIALFSLAVKARESALDSSRASVAGVLAYSFVMQLISPKVGYFMISDYLFIVILMGTFIVYLTHILTVSEWIQKHASDVIMQRIKGCVVLGLYGLLLSMIFIFISV